MCEVVKVLERELDNSGLIYIYQEGDEGKWYVYERSAYFWILTVYLKTWLSVTVIKNMC